MDTQANPLFKTSTLEELKDELEKNEHLFKDEANSRTSLRLGENSRMSEGRNRKLEEGNCKNSCNDDEHCENNGGEVLGERVDAGLGNHK